MGGLVLASMVCVVLLWVPGLAVVALLAPWASRLVAIAVAPAVSFALLFGVGSYLDLAGVKVEWQTVALPVVVLSAAVLGWATFRRAHLPVTWRAGHILLGASMLIALGLWLAVIGSLNAVPPNDDSALHAIMASRIELLGTLRPDRIIATDLASGIGGVSYYPMGLHLIASFLMALTGIGVALALQLVVVTCCAVAMPLGTYVLTRHIATSFASRADVVAGVAALVVAVLPTFPWGQLTWGPLALASGAALVPAVVLLALWLPAGHRWLGVLFGLAISGVFVVHNSQALAVVVLAGPMLIAVLGRNWVVWRGVLGRLLTVLAVSVLVLVPVLGTLVGGAAERGIGIQGTILDPIPALRAAWINLSIGALNADQLTSWQWATAIMLTLLVGVGIWCGRSSALMVGLAIGSGLIMVVVWGCLAGLAWARLIAFPWYSGGYRLSVTLCIPVAVFIGAGVARLIQQRARRLILLPVGAVAVVACVATSAQLGRYTYANYSVVTAADRATYRWLAIHQTVGSRVLNDYGDGSMWMYVLAGATPMFAPKTDLWTSQQWADRWHLLTHGSSPDARALKTARVYGVTFAVVGERTAADHKQLLSAASLASSPAWRQVFRSGDAYVFQLVSSP
jgi:hypothetical protein